VFCPYLALIITTDKQPPLPDISLSPRFPRSNLGKLQQGNKNFDGVTIGII